MPSLLLGLLFSSLDASIVSTSLVTISIELHDFLKAPWVVLAYLLAYLGLAIAFAKFSDVYGRRDSICVAWVLFAGFSVGCALATTMPQLYVYPHIPPNPPAVSNALINHLTVSSVVLSRVWEALDFIV